LKTCGAEILVVTHSH